MNTDRTRVPASSSPSPSPSPSRRSLGKKISAIGARLTRTLSYPDENHEEEGDVYSVASSEPPSYYESDSRARDVLQSTGRGGLGNIRQASNARLDSGVDNFSPTRGREPFPAQAPAAIFSTGRGGAGNLRSPVRDPAPADDSAEQDIVREYAAAHEGAPVSSGRGGRGNISQGSSRALVLSPAAVYSTGRGGAGNIFPGDARRAEQIDAEERKRAASHDGPHSTGRGGRANITTLPQPPVEQHEQTPTQYESTGRGGAGHFLSDGARSKSNTRV